MKILVLNGPNLDQLGTREPEIYGHASYADLVALCQETARELNLEVDVRQTNDESEMIRWIHEAATSNLSVVLNPAAFTHYSYALRDACSMLTAPLIEVHISNPQAREAFRHHSVISGVAKGTITGMGLRSYTLALRALAGR